MIMNLIAAGVATLVGTCTASNLAKSEAGPANLHGLPGAGNPIFERQFHSGAPSASQAAPSQNHARAEVERGYGRGNPIHDRFR